MQGELCRQQQVFTSAKEKIRGLEMQNLATLLDAPLQGDEKAEMRASILIYYPFNDWLDGFKPKKKTAK